MDYQEYSPLTTRTAEEVAYNVRAYFNKVYMWLALSMLVSAGLAIYVENDVPLMFKIVENYMVLGFVTLGIVAIMCLAANKLTSGALKVLLLVYSALQGALFSPLLHFYTNESLGLTFACTAGMFGLMALYGLTTKRNLSGLGRTLMMLLFGLILASIANIFVGGSTMNLVICIAGIVIFCLFTAYDFQQLQQEGAYLEDEVDREKGAILGALNLYINFYNIFLYLLRFLGDRE